MGMIKAILSDIPSMTTLVIPPRKAAKFQGILQIPKLFHPTGGFLPDPFVSQRPRCLYAYEIVVFEPLHTYSHNNK